MQVCPGARGSERHSSVHHSTSPSFSTARQRQTPLPPLPPAVYCCSSPQSDTPTHAAGPPSGPTHGDKANAAGCRTLPPLAAYAPPPAGEVHKFRSPLAQRQTVHSYLLRIRLIGKSRRTAHPLSL